MKGEAKDWFAQVMAESPKSDTLIVAPIYAMLSIVVPVSLVNKLADHHVEDHAVSNLFRRRAFYMPLKSVLADKSHVNGMGQNRFSTVVESPGTGKTSTILATAASLMQLVALRVGSAQLGISFPTHAAAEAVIRQLASFCTQHGLSSRPALTVDRELTERPPDAWFTSGFRVSINLPVALPGLFVPEGSQTISRGELAWIRESVLRHVLYCGRPNYSQLAIRAQLRDAILVTRPG
ncbi:hypothetical protein BDW62DRAFT_203143 [Aspergillus aurantiobrunneus]